MCALNHYISCARAHIVNVPVYPSIHYTFNPPLLQNLERNRCTLNCDYDPRVANLLK